MECKCGRKAIYKRKWEGKGYCGFCLSRVVEKTFKQTTSNTSLIEGKDKIAVAISGGKDSSVLLKLLYKTFKENRNVELVPILIDEGIKGYRDKSIKYAKKLCKRLDLNLNIFSFGNEFDLKLDELGDVKFCTYCGIFRRYLLNKKAREMDCNKMVVGHNLDDEAESVMMNFIRDDISRFKRLGAEPSLLDDKKFVPRFKPLRKLSEKELTIYAIFNDLPFFEGECPYSQDNVRRDVLNVINNLEEKYPGTKVKIVSFYDKLKPELNTKVKGALKYCKKCQEPTSKEICQTCKKLKELKEKSS